VTPADGDEVEDDPSHAWNRTLVGWHVAFWVFLSLALLRAATAADLGRTDRLVESFAVGGLALAYAGLRPRPVNRLDRRNLAYLLIAIVVSGVACGVDPTMSMVLFIAYPQMWIFSAGNRSGVILTASLTVSSLVGFLRADGWSVHGFWVIGPSMLVSLLFSILMGIWIAKIIDQSRDRADLIRQLEATRTELGDAHHAQGVMAERERVAREIHDTLAQGFTSVIMLAQAARATTADSSPAAGRLDAIEAVARENLGEARALVAAFSPVGLDGATLVDAIRRLGSRFEVETGVRVTVAVSGEPAGLSRDREVVLLRAAQEALANVRRHAGAEAVTVRLTANAEGARIEVADDGVGFAPETPAGFGLTGMRDRVQDAGGSLDVASEPGHGTRVSVRVPVRPVGGGGAE
jgi:signal transduction histidine kinase